MSDITTYMAVQGHTPNTVVRAGRSAVCGCVTCRTVYVERPGDNGKHIGPCPAPHDVSDSRSTSTPSMGSDSNEMT